MLSEDIVEIAGKSDTYSKYYGDNYESSGSPKGYDLESIFRNPQDNIDSIIRLSKYYYAKVGIIMRVVNIIRDFGIGQIKLNYPTKNKKAKTVIESFNKRIQLKQVLNDIVFELGLTGNCAGYNREGKRIDIYPINSIEVSPLIANNKPVLFYKNPMVTTDSFLIDDKEMLKNLELTYPKEIIKGLDQSKDKIVLNVNNTFYLKTNSSRYEPYGITFLLPAFDELAHKTILKEAERATATGIIEKILRISVGDKDHKPKQPEIDYYNNLITGKKGSLKVTVPYFVNLEWIEPSVDIFGDKKFLQVDKDILSALGVSLTLIRGEGGGNYSEGVIALTGLIKTIESLREPIPDVVNEWYRQECKRNGIKEEYAPTIEFVPVEIDKTAKLEMLKWLFQNAGMPYEVLYNEAGYDYLSVKLKREEENVETIEDIFKLRQQPFQGNNGANSDNNGRPVKGIEERKTDKSQSNNKQPRPSTVK